MAHKSSQTLLRRRANAQLNFTFHGVSIPLLSTLSPGQTDSQVDASFGLAFNLRFVWPPTCVDFGRAQIWTRVDASFYYHLATQRKSTQVDRK